MLYFANPTGSRRVRDAMTAGTLGFIDTPLQGNRRPGGVTWCADNGCFNDTAFDESRWWEWLVDNCGASDSCVFAVAPDVVGDAAATLARSAPWLARIRALGYPVAFVAQDGWESITVPWDEFDVLFVGGSTAFKLGRVARGAVADAKRRGKHVHMGRVNSFRRYRYAEAIGCDSVDGTFLTFGPDKNLPLLESWIHRVESEPSLFGLDAERYRWHDKEEV